MNFEQARLHMIEQQIRPWNVLEPKLLEVLAQVKREAFVPPELQNLAFTDTELPIGSGQFMLAPRVQARMIHDLKLKPTDKVLEIGTGTGYTAALMAHMATHVTTYEIHADLAKISQHNLAQENIKNVTVIHGDGSIEANIRPNVYDVVVLSGSIESVVPILAWLKVGGHMGVIVGNEPMMRYTLLDRVDLTSVVSTEPWDTVAPRLSGFAQSSQFEF